MGYQVMVLAAWSPSRTGLQNCRKCAITSQCFSYDLRCCQDVNFQSTINTSVLMPRYRQGYYVLYRYIDVRSQVTFRSKVIHIRKLVFIKRKTPMQMLFHIIRKIDECREKHYTEQSHKIPTKHKKHICVYSYGNITFSKHSPRFDRTYLPEMLDTGALIKAVQSDERYNCQNQSNHLEFYLAYIT